MLETSWTAAALTQGRCICMVPLLNANSKRGCIWEHDQGEADLQNVVWPADCTFGYYGMEKVMTPPEGEPPPRPVLRFREDTLPPLESMNVSWPPWPSPITNSWPSAEMTWGRSTVLMPCTTTCRQHLNLGNMTRGSAIYTQHVAVMLSFNNKTSPRSGGKQKLQKLLISHTFLI